MIGDSCNVGDKQHVEKIPNQVVDSISWEDQQKEEQIIFDSNELGITLFVDLL